MKLKRLTLLTVKSSKRFSRGTALSVCSPKVLAKMLRYWHGFAWSVCFLYRSCKCSPKLRWLVIYKDIFSLSKFVLIEKVLGSILVFEIILRFMTFMNRHM